MLVPDWGTEGWFLTSDGVVVGVVCNQNSICDSVPYDLMENKLSESQTEAEQ